MARARADSLSRRAVTLALASACALAAAGAQAQAAEDPLIASLQEVRAELLQLREMLSMAWLIGTDVHARNGDITAEAVDALADPQGKLAALVVQAHGSRGGLYRIPWRHVELTSDHSRILVPLARHNVYDYRLSRASLLAHERRLSVMLRARILLRHGQHYGKIADIVASREGELRAVVIRPLVNDGYTPFAYPYRHEDYRDGVYTMRYDYSQLARIALPEAGALDVASPRPRLAIGALGRSSAGGQQRYDSGFLNIP